MTYDPSSADGEKILKQLAEYLNVDVIDLKAALKNTASFHKTFRTLTDK